MCYIPCDPKKCPGIPRRQTNFLWAAEEAGVNLCYSYEACGGVDKETDYVMQCEAKGGYLLNGQVRSHASYFDACNIQLLSSPDLQHLLLYMIHKQNVRPHSSARATSLASSVKFPRAYQTATIRTVANALGIKAFTSRKRYTCPMGNISQHMVSTPAPQRHIFCEHHNRTKRHHQSIG